MATNIMKEVNIKNIDTGEIIGTRPVGADAENIIVSYDSYGNIIEDTSSGAVVTSTRKASTTLKNLKNSVDGKGDYLTVRSVIEDNIEKQKIELRSGGSGGQTLSSIDIGAAISPMTGATAISDGTSGLVPIPRMGDQNKVLKGDGTWGTVQLDVSEMSGATSSTAGVAGLVPAPAAGDNIKSLYGDGTWKKTNDSRDITLIAANWDASLKTQIINIQGITSSTNGVISLGQNVTDAQHNAAANAKIYIIDQSNSSITFKCRGDIPTIDIPIEIIILT